MRMQVRSLALPNGLKIWHCHELWCGLQTWLRSVIAVAVAVAGSCSSYLTPSLGTSICHGCNPKKKKKEKKKTQTEERAAVQHFRQGCGLLGTEGEGRDRE